MCLYKDQNVESRLIEREQETIKPTNVKFSSNIGPLNFTNILENVDLGRLNFPEENKVEVNSKSNKERLEKNTIISRTSSYKN